MSAASRGSWRWRFAIAAACGAAAVVVLALLSTVFSGRDEPPLEAPAAEAASSTSVPPAASHSASAVAVRTPGLEALGAPDDPLPAPLPLPDIGGPFQARAVADGLARQVLAGGPDALPVLLAALQASGIAIVGPGRAVALRPGEPWQGLIMQPWEVRAAALMVRPERTISFTLDDLGGALRTLVPELEGAAIEQLILDDLRTLAESHEPTRRFFGHFIAALGRHAASRPSYDLLGAVDARTLRLDGLQASLVLRRTAFDILMLADTDESASAGESGSAGGIFRGWTAAAAGPLDWFAPPLHAQAALPCTLSDTERTIMDVVALGSQLGFGGLQVGNMGMQGITSYLQSHGFAGGANLGRASNIASTVLAFAQFMAMYAALEVNITLDAPPLVRTKKRLPQSGERRQLTALVKMNIGNAQMLNCFRIMLNAAGLDFSLPNDGPVKGARLRWYGVEGFDQAAAALHGGGEAIVQFAAPEASRIQGGGNAATSANAVTNAITGEDGKVQIGVEGRGQARDISNDATEVQKSARVRVDVALKGADLFGDVSEAIGTGAGGLVSLATVPLSVLSRMQWASAGHQSFPVTDWRDGPAEWTGTITYTKVTEWNTSTRLTGVYHSQEYSEALTVNIDLGEPLQGSSVFGGGAAMLGGRASATYRFRNARPGGRLVQCGGRGPAHDLKSLSLDTAEGSGTGTASAVLGISADGQYSITVQPDVLLTTQSTSSAEQMVVRCGSPPENQQGATTRHSGSMAASVDIQGDGRIDPERPDRLTGRTEETEGPTTRTLTWDLQRR